MNIPIYNCLIDESDDDATGIYAISFVDCPANEVDFVALSRQQEEHLSRDEKRHILTGVVLQPDQMIYRNTPQMGEYYIKFSAEQIALIAQKMMRQGVALRTTTHQHSQPLEGNYMTEMWIVEDPERDKSRALGFANLPQGTLMCSYKIEDQNYWDEQVMTGRVKGFSLEGLFNQVVACGSHRKQTKTNDNKKMNNRKSKHTLLRRIARLLLGIEDVKKKDATDSGEPYIIFTLADGKEVYVDQDGFATLNDEQLPAGEHKLANGSLLVVDKDGNMLETRESSDSNINSPEAKPRETLRKKRQAFADQETEDKTPQPANASENLKTKIAEMQTAIDNLTEALEEAQSQVETLRRSTPSARPMVAPRVSADSRPMSNAERMAAALSQSIQRRK